MEDDEPFPKAEKEDFISEKKQIKSNTIKEIDKGVDKPEKLLLGENNPF
jgi:hypothetical protein